MWSRVDASRRQAPALGPFSARQPALNPCRCIQQFCVERTVQSDMHRTTRGCGLGHSLPPNLATSFTVSPHLQYYGVCISILQYTDRIYASLIIQSSAHNSGKVVLFSNIREIHSGYHINSSCCNRFILSKTKRRRRRRSNEAVSQVIICPIYSVLSSKLPQSALDSTGL